MIINKIYNETDKTLSKFDPGDLFEYNGLLCIKTDKQDEDKDNELIYDLCVVLATGKLIPILDCTYINEVELIGTYGDDAVLNYTTKK